MIRKLLIWWHRRRAVHHLSWAAQGGYAFPDHSSDYHRVWAEWHHQQVKRLEQL